MSVMKFENLVPMEMTGKVNLHFHYETIWPQPSNPSAINQLLWILLHQRMMNWTPPSKQDLPPIEAFARQEKVYFCLLAADIPFLPEFTIVFLDSIPRNFPIRARNWTGSISEIQFRFRSAENDCGYSFSWVVSIKNLKIGHIIHTLSSS